MQNDILGTLGIIDYLHICFIAHKISFFDVIKVIVNFFLYFRSLNDLKCIDYEKENQHHLRTIGLAT